MADKTIKPCPFCNGSALLNANYSYRTRTFFVFVKCEICGGQGKAFTDSNDPEHSNWNDSACNSAVDAWNMRATDTLKN